MIQYVFPVRGFKGPVNLHHSVHIGASDMFAPLGTDVLAMCAGRVDGAGYGSVSGNYVSMRGVDGLDYWYAHGDTAPLVSRGQHIREGTRLFGVGDTGNARGTGTHLHLGGGYGIADGVGPSGGAGINYDFVALLRRVLTEGGGSPAPPPRVVHVGDEYRVLSHGLRLRDKAGLSGLVITELVKGAIVRVKSLGVTEADGHRWVHVDGGYVSMTYLEYLGPAPVPPVATDSTKLKHVTDPNGPILSSLRTQIQEAQGLAEQLQNIYNEIERHGA